MDENILAINIPNGVSIVVMAAIGGILIAAIKKAMGRKSSDVSTGPAFTG